MHLLLESTSHSAHTTHGPRWTSTDAGVHGSTEMSLRHAAWSRTALSSVLREDVAEIILRHLPDRDAPEKRKLNGSDSGLPPKLQNNNVCTQY